MKKRYAYVLPLLLAISSPVAADDPATHDGGPKAHEGGAGGDQGGNDHVYDGDPNSVDVGGMCCGRKTPIGTDENGNPSQDTPGLGPDWDPYRDDTSGPTAEDLATDWGWDE